MAHETRHVHLVSPLKPEELMVQRAEIVEKLGRPFRCELDLLSPDPALKFEKLLGDKMTVVLTLPDGERYFNGHVARFSQGGAMGRYTRYKCSLRPHFWLLTRASDSRIFKKSTIPAIIKQVIGQFGIGDVDDKNLHGTYPSREYTVQYRETYFDFISRLMEEEGIYYWFRHTKDSHVMVLGDDPNSHKPAKGWEEIPFIDPDVNKAPREEHFSEWERVQELKTAAFAVNDYDFEVPKADLLAKSTKALAHKFATLEMYDPLAGYVEALDAGNDGDTNRGDRGELFARVRLEELQASFDRCEGYGNARGAGVGDTFKLTGHGRADQNAEHLIVRADYTMFQPGFDAGSAAGKDSDGDDEEEKLYEIEVVVQPAKTPFRPRRITERPVIAGPHAGLVVGSGEIWTDKYGRVKVHFPWDREDMEGCWVRVAQVWAGGGWGGLQVPRVGQEVIVEFVGGDPDRPIITGRVYNGTNAAPFGLPNGATRSGLLTRSTSGGSADTCNEISLEDKAGEEQMFMHAEKNMDTEVEKDQTLWVGQDRVKTVDRNQMEEVKGNKKIQIHGAHVEDIQKTMSLHVVGNEDESIDGSRTVKVGGSHTETIMGVQGVTVGGAGAWSCGGAGTINWGGVGAISVGGNLTFGVGGDMNQSVNKNATLEVSENIATTAGKNLTTDVTENMATTVKKKSTTNVDDEMKITVKKGFGLKAKEIVIEGEDQITIKSGDSKIILKKNGDISIEGKNVKVSGDSAITHKGGKVTSN